MDLRQLESLVAVADTGSFSRAAAAINLAQPTLSRRVGLLEAELGERLLVRTGRGATPTEAGHILLVHARAMLGTARRARDELRDLHESPGGRVTVGLPPRVARALGAVLVRRFRERFPRAVISVSEGLSLQLREWLLAGRLDLALLFDPQPSPQLSCTTVMREPLLLVAPPGTVLPKRVALAALAQHPVVLPSAPNAIRNLLDEVLRPRRIVLDVVAEVGAVHTALSLVAQGVACSILPQSAVAHGEGRSLARAAIGPPVVRNNLLLATPLARPATRLTRGAAALLQSLDFTML